jgi:outer membrane protein
MRTFVLTGALIAAGVVVLGITAQSAPPTTTAAAANGLKIGYINSERLVREAPGAAEAQTTMQREAKKIEADLELLQDSVENLIADYNQKQVMLSPDAKKKQQDAITAKRTTLQQRSAAAQQQMENRQRQLIQPIMDRINKVIDDVRKEQGFALIFNAPGAIVSADTTLDLTSAVLTRLKGSAPAAPKKPGS